MPLELQIIRASEFVSVGAHGHLNFETSRQALDVMARACLMRGLDRALLDLRALPIPDRPIFTPSELAALVGTFRDAGFGRHQRLAVLYRTDPHQGARLFAFISRLRGWQVRAFDEFEEALLWLSESQRKRPQLAAQEIKIAQSKVKPKKAIGRITRPCRN